MFIFIDISIVLLIIAFHLLLIFPFRHIAKLLFLGIRITSHRASGKECYLFSFLNIHYSENTDKK